MKVMLRFALMGAAGIVAVAIFFALKGEWGEGPAIVASLVFFGGLWAIETLERAGQTRWILFQAALLGFLAAAIIMAQRGRVIPFLPNVASAVVAFVFPVLMFANANAADEEGKKNREEEPPPPPTTP